MGFLTVVQNKRFEDKVAELVHRLPPIPRNVEVLMGAVADGATPDELVALIGGDPGLCADFLRLANMACQIPEGKIETVEEAVSRMGIGPLVQLIGVSYTGRIIKEEFAALQHLQEYFNHSRQISLCCRVIAEVCGLDEHGRQAYAVAGLIHDIGRLVILLAGNETGAHLMGTSWRAMKSVISDEVQLLGMDHCTVGMSLCKKWGFSEFMQQGVLRHHDPLRCGDFSLPGAFIYIAHFVSCSDFTGEMLSNMLGAEILAGVGMTGRDFAQARKTYFSRKASSGL